MKWPDIIRNVAAATDADMDAERLITLIERACKDAHDVEDLRGIYDDELTHAPFFDRLKAELEARHQTMEPIILAQVRAVVHAFSQLLSRLSNLRKGVAARIEAIRRILSGMEEAARIIETFQPGRPQCPRCGSQRLDTRKTTAFGTNQYERLCLACGDMQEWEDGVALWKALSSENDKN